MDARWDLVADERRALADLVDTLTPQQAASPSLCDSWSVQDVVAHVMVGPTATIREVLGAMVRGRMDFHRANLVMVANRAHLTLDELADLLRTLAGSRFTPPGMDWRAPLTDVLVHREDVAVPLGLPSDRPVEPWSIALDLLRSRRAGGVFGPKGRPDVTLVATDLDWRAGDGPEVRGPAAALGITLAGRKARVDDLQGPGLDPLTGWLATTG